MLSTLDDLFGQIVHSERKAQERKNYLNEIRNEIGSTQEVVKELEEQNAFLNKDFALKVYELSEEELEIKWLRNKEEILLQQRKNLQEEKSDHQAKIESLDKQSKTCTEQFIHDVTEFTTKQSFLGDGYVSKEEKAKEELLQLQNKRDCLRKELDKYSQQKEKINSLSSDLLKLKDELSHFGNQNEDTESKLAKLRKTTSDKETEKKKLSSIPQTDVEFLSLNRDLRKIKSENLEQQCQTLQQELQRLQKAVWQKQLKQHSQMKSKHQMSTQSPVPCQDDGIGDYSIASLHLLFDDEEKNTGNVEKEDKAMAPSSSAKKRKGLFHSRKRSNASAEKNEGEKGPKIQ